MIFTGFGSTIPSDKSHKADLRPQRWFADPFTAKLIENWKNRNKGKIEADADAALTEFLRKAYGKQVSVADFYARARLRWHMRIPAVLVDKALGRLPTVPMSEVRWRESVGHPRFPVGLEKSNFHSFAPLEIYKIKKAWLRFSKDLWPEEHLAFETAEKHYRCGNISYTIWKSLTAGLLERIAQERKEYLPHWDYRILIPCWLAHRLREKRQDGKRGYSPQLMLEQLAALSTLLGTFWDAIATDREGRERSLSAKHLDRLLRSRSEGKGELASWLYKEAVGDLRDFVKKREKSHRPSPDYSRISVSASIVTPAIYRDCLSRALNSGPPGWQIERPFQPTRYEMAAATILAFRAGLRMREILGLRVGDFIDSDGIFELHLEANAARPLKTTKSRRILPLDVLLSESEKKYVLEWLSRRQAHARILKKDINCFGPPWHRGVIDSGPYFRAFEKIFEEAEQPYLAFRHFRHSYSSYLLTNLTLPSEEAARCIPAQFRAEINWGRRTALSRRFLGEERIGQSALHAVSLSMGHTGIYRTLESYQHLLDLTLGLYVNDANIVGTEGRALLYYTGLIYARREEKKICQPLQIADPSSYKSPKKSASRLSSRPTVYKSTDSAWAAGKSEATLENDRLRREAELMSACASNFQEAVDWTVVRHIMKTEDEASLAEAKAKFGISDEDADHWREFDRKWNKEWSKSKSLKQYSPDYFGAQASFYLNLLWAGYQSKRPSDEVREAISNFVAGYHLNTSGSRMGKIERCLRLEDYLLSIGLRPEHFDYTESTSNQVKAYDLADWKNGCPPQASFKYGRARRVCLKNGNPRLRLRQEEELDALGSSSDVSRAARALIALYKKQEAEGVQTDRAAVDSEDDKDHRHVTAAFNFFLYLVAAVEKITPVALHATSKDWKSDRDFERISRKARVRYKMPGRE